MQFRICLYTHFFYCDVSVAVIAWVLQSGFTNDVMKTLKRQWKLFRIFEKLQS